MAQNEDERVAALARDILEYLRTHPRAVDTVEGITRWWLHMHARESVCREVESALDSLIEQGLVERIVKADKQAIYRSAEKRDRQ